MRTNAAVLPLCASTPEVGNESLDRHDRARSQHAQLLAQVTRVARGLMATASATGAFTASGILSLLLRAGPADLNRSRRFLSGSLRGQAASAEG